MCHISVAIGSIFPGHLVNTGKVTLECFPRGDNPFITSDILIEYDIYEEGSTDNSTNANLQHALASTHFWKMNDIMNSYFEQMIDRAKRYYGSESVKTRLDGPVASCPKPNRYNGSIWCKRFNVIQWIMIDQEEDNKLPCCSLIDSEIEALEAEADGRCDGGC
jgi:hypothetical protein